MTCTAQITQNGHEVIDSETGASYSGRCFGRFEAEITARNLNDHPTYWVVPTTGKWPTFGPAEGITCDTFAGACEEARSRGVRSVFIFWVEGTDPAYRRRRIILP